MIALEAILRRERAVVAAGLAALVALAWIYVWQGAGMGMSALDMTSATLFPHQQDVPGDMDPTIPVVVLMWWVMMIAMMTPSAAPLVLLYMRVARDRGGRQEAGTAIAPASFLAAGYLLAWLAFSIVAALAQEMLQPAGLISGMMLWSKTAVLSATVLAAAGIYQLSPLKKTCLSKCRAPVQFLVQHWRAGRGGAMRLGFLHGAYCVGCCWLLMALLFVGGIMNLVWIAGLTLFVAVEKLAPSGATISAWSGALLLFWAAATLIV